MNIGQAELVNKNMDKKGTLSNLMEGKRGLIMGVANERSIAWGIANTLHEHGADLAFTYQGDAFKKRVEPLAESVGSEVVENCDVADEKDLDRIFDVLNDSWGGLDFIVHAIAYSDKEELKGRYVDTSLDNFLRSMHISCYSFTSIMQRASKLMNNGGSAITLSYYGAQKVMPNYNVMGVAKAALEASVRYIAVDLGDMNIRVNAISAGPMRTLAGSAIGNARQTFKYNKLTAPLGRSVELDEIGGTGLYLLSDLSSAVTGEIHYVDCGYNVVGMPQHENLSELSKNGNS
jgi:enoyl-[acyl-carrier protein] reductase I